MAAVLAAAAAPAFAQVAPALAVLLKPFPTGDGSGIAAIDVTIEIDQVDPTPLRLRLPLVVNNVETIAGSLDEVQAEDKRGPLALSSRLEGPAGTGTRFWVPARPVTGPLKIRYRAPIETRLAARGAAPPLELRSEAGAFSGAGSTFLLLPEGDQPRRLSISWDLSALPASSAAISSLGREGGAEFPPRPASTLDRSFFMAGAIGLHPAPRDPGRFRAAWQGQPPFDARTLMAWTGTMHGHFLRFFRVAEPMPYTVFLRRNLVNPGGGVGLASAFVATYGEKTEAEQLKLTLAHEMFHTFSPMLSAPAGLESSWFGEGLATHYQRVLPLRFGQIDAETFLEDLNGTAARYYTSIMAEVPNSEVPARFWEDTRIRTLPYDRGALYFSDLNHRVKKASGGRRSLDDLMLAMVERQRRGRALSHADWEDLLRAELGEPGVEHFRATLAGSMPVPASEAFGPCFRRTKKPLRRYELGFDPKVLVEPRRVVRGLVPGSAAERAGLRNGDEIMRPVPQDAIQGDQQALLRLEIKRGETTLPLSYLPRGETVEAWQWERTSAGSDHCAI